ncbi:MAG: tetratricopeptide repeat protein, partial [Vicinamibacterales bacterium]
PSDASVFARLSQAYAWADQPVAALSAIEGALALEPDVPEYLRAKATLASWAGRYHAAGDAYRRLGRSLPDDPDVALGLARVSAWAGETDEAVDAYRRYLAVHPEAGTVWLELARTESWRGNYAAALDVLDDYHARFGPSREYTRERADVLARGGHPTQAVRLSTSLLLDEPDSPRDNLTRAIALAMRQQAREALESLNSVRRSHPDLPETRAAARVVRTLLASSAEPRASLYNDSDSLQVQRLAPRINIALTTGTQFSAGYEREELEARAGSGLEQIGGGRQARHEHVWLGAAQRLQAVTLRGRLGYGSSAERDLTTYAVGAEIRPIDTVMVSLDRSTGFLVVSPRTLGLGLTKRRHQIRIEWQPTLRTYVDLDGSHETFSDGNERWEFRLAPRRSVARTQRINLDLGISMYRLSALLDLDNGYYDPRSYESYSLTAFPYWKISENVGVGAVFAVGPQRDDRSPSFRLGANAAAEATVGIYEPWVLKISGSATFNQRLESGAFKGYGGAVSLARRF